MKAAQFVCRDNSGLKKRILSVSIHQDMDDSPDLSWIGEYASKPGPDDRTIDREERGDMERGEYRYFIACNSGEETGNPKSVELDYQRMEDYNRQVWCMLGVWASAQVQLGGNVCQVIRSGGLWGIESDSGEDYLAEEGKNQLADLHNELLAIGFTKSQISNAFKEVKTGEG